MTEKKVIIIVVVLLAVLGVVFFIYEKNKNAIVPPVTAPATQVVPNTGKAATVAASVYGKPVKAATVAASLYGKPVNATPAPALTTTSINLSNSNALANAAAASIPVLDNYTVWAATMMQRLHDTGNIDIYNQLLTQLKCIVNNDNSNPYSNLYRLDTRAYYNQNIPALPAYPSLILAATAAQQQKSIVVSPYSIQPLDAMPSVQITGQTLFVNVCSIMALLAKNYVQAFDKGQAVGVRQGWVNDSWSNLINQEQGTTGPAGLSAPNPYGLADNDNNFVPYCANLIYWFNCAVTDVWPVQPSPPPVDVLAIVGDVLKAASIVVMCIP